MMKKMAEARRDAELAVAIGIVLSRVLVTGHSGKALDRWRRRNPRKDYFHWEMTTVPKASIAAVNGFAVEGGSVLRRAYNIDATKPIARFLADEDRSEGLPRLPTSMERPEGEEE
jgi:enoyl-CoA hydratase/carnithine racemase